VDELARDGVKLCFADVGKGAPPIVLVHDLADDHTCLAAELDHFRRRHRTVAVDLRGHGESDKPEQAYTVRLFADDLAWLAYELGLYQPVIVGHGFGGAVALDLAASYPDLPGAVVLVDTPARWLTSPAAPSSDPAVGGGLFPPLDALSLEPRRVVASALEHLATWDGAAALAACAVPLLCVETGAPGGAASAVVDLARPRDLCPLTTIERAAHGEDRQAPQGSPDALSSVERVIAAIDHFLCGLTVDA
jgi:pimeloyl-ACP methyl ester carboxylesterase